MGKTLNQRRKYPKKELIRDISMEGVQPSDIVIPVLGPTGVGKSTFVNTLMGKNVVNVGHDLKPCTGNLQPVIIPLPEDLLKDRRLVIVDTPGFDDTYIDDQETLKHTTTWLASSYGDEMKIGGIIYLHDISQPRMNGLRGDSDIFHRLLGCSTLESVVLGTTKWSNIELEQDKNHERQLDHIWRNMIRKGSAMHRFKNTPEDAWHMVNCILHKARKNLEPTKIVQSWIDSANPQGLNKSWIKAEIKIKSGGTVTDGRPTDFIILVMGVIGVGKSTFINTLVGKEVVEVDHCLTSSAKMPQPVVTQIPDRSLVAHRLILVDTPGFEDTYQGESEILDRIKAWLVSSYGNGMKLGGVIYLHTTSQLHQGKPRRNIETFRKLCGDNGFRSVILGIAQWGDIGPEGGKECERILVESWKGRTDGGSTIYMLENTPNSAWEMVGLLINNAGCLQQPKLEERTEGPRPKTKIKQSQNEIFSWLFPSTS